MISYGVSGEWERMSEWNLVDAREESQGLHVMRIASERERNIYCVLKKKKK